MCYTPYTLKERIDNRLVQVPCGRCAKCIQRRINGWLFRLMQEEKVCSSAHFITLTYDDEHLKGSEEGLPTLCKADLQKYWKRLRKLHPDRKIKYFAVGEYGGTSTLRPHYHVILFNADEQQIIDAWSLDGKSIGHIHFGNVTYASVTYSLSYMFKRNDTIKFKEKEFGVMSKGLGRSYLTKNIRKWHKADIEERVYINLDDGKRAAMPRYYRDKIYTDSEKKSLALIGERKTVEKIAKEVEKGGKDYYRNRKLSIAEAGKRMSRKTKSKSKL